MSRQPATSQQKSLTLTEELEKLEQSITLTLQEIDHNFSRAHRIVTSNILPIVEQYAGHSKDVWEGSKFWKQFFESSANVSLSGYEEQPSVQDTEETVTEESNATTQSNIETSESYETPTAQHISSESIQDIDLSNLTISPSHSTPRPTRAKLNKSDKNDSPYRALGRDVNTTTQLDDTELSHADDGPHTPGRRTSNLDDVAMTPPEEDSPSLPRNPPSSNRPGTLKQRNDPVLHRVLDKTYRIQATPLKSARYAAKPTTTPRTANRTIGRLDYANSALDSSPDVAPPQLHAEIFDSPERRRYGDSPAKDNRKQGQQRTPGVSVLTPARNRYGNPGGTQAPVRTPGIWDSDDEEDEEFDEDTGMPRGASPPKTIQFHIPQSRLLKTPAREASRQIVDDVLASAGFGRNGHHEDLSEDFEIDVDLDADYDAAGAEATSPSVVRGAFNIEDETF